MVESPHDCPAGCGRQFGTQNGAVMHAINKSDEVHNRITSKSDAYGASTPSTKGESLEDQGPTGTDTTPPETSSRTDNPLFYGAEDAPDTAPESSSRERPDEVNEIAGALADEGHTVVDRHGTVAAATPVSKCGHCNGATVESRPGARFRLEDGTIVALDEADRFCPDCGAITEADGGVLK